MPYYSGRGIIRALPEWCILEKGVAATIFRTCQCSLSFQVVTPIEEFMGETKRGK